MPNNGTTKRARLSKFRYQMQKDFEDTQKNRYDIEGCSDTKHYVFQRSDMFLDALFPSLLEDFMYEA